MTPIPDHLRGLLMTVFAVIVLSPDALIVRLIEADRWTLLWWRGLLMAIGLGLYLLLRHRGQAVARARSIGALGLLSAVLFTFSTILFVTSITLTAAANTLVIVSAAPLFAALFSRLFLKEPVPWRTWAAVAVAIAGITVIFAGNLGGSIAVMETGEAAGEGIPHSLWGDICAVGTACFLAGHLVVARRSRPVSMVPAVALSGLIVAAMMTPIAAPLQVTAEDMVLLLVLGLVIMPVSFGLITDGPRYLPAAEVSLILLLETVLGPFWVWLALGEVPDAQTFVGGAVVLITLVIHAILGLRRRGG